MIGDSGCSIITRSAGLGIVLGSAIILAAACSPSLSEQPEEPAQVPPPGLDFVPPAPGSYELPTIQSAVDGGVIDADGTDRRLFDYLGDKYVLLSFIYLNCPDAKGCPLANANFYMIRQDLEAEPALAKQVRLVSLSFDPERDTPETMLRHWGPDYLESGWDDRLWALLTTTSRADLQPILDGFNQYIVREIGENGKETGNITHVLKVFLIDRQLNVRNVYSTSYLHPAIAINDLKTLVMREAEVS
jgi:cytochrome c peroxidase